MTKTYSAKLAEAIEAKLNPGHPFTITADRAYWMGYIFIEHPNGASVNWTPWALDKRISPEDKAITAALSHAGYHLTPKVFHTPEWQDKFREARADWDTALNHDNLEGADQ